MWLFNFKIFWIIFYACLCCISLLNFYSFSRCCIIPFILTIHPILVCLLLRRCSIYTVVLVIIFLYSISIRSIVIFCSCNILLGLLVICLCWLIFGSLCCIVLLFIAYAVIILLTIGVVSYLLFVNVSILFLIVVRFLSILLLDSFFYFRLLI